MIFEISSRSELAPLGPSFRRRRIAGRSCRSPLRVKTIKLLIRFDKAIRQVGIRDAGAVGSGWLGETLRDVIGVIPGGVGEGVTAPLEKTDSVVASVL